MKYIWDNNWFFVPVAMFFGFCAMVALLAPYGQEIVFFNDLRREPLNSFFQFLTHCGEAWAYLFFGVAAMFWRPRYGAVVAALGLATVPFVYWVKDTAGVDRPATFFEKRPALAQPTFVPEVSLNRGQTSFPSGHSTAAFGLYTLMTFVATSERRKTWGLPFALLAIGVAVSRIFLVQHFLIDVLAGATLGLVLGSLIWWFYQRFSQPINASGRRADGGFA